MRCRDSCASVWCVPCPRVCARSLCASLPLSLLPFGFAFCVVCHHLPRAPLAAPALRSPQMSGPARPQGARDARKTKKGQSTTRQVTVPLRYRVSGRTSLLMSFMIANPFTPARTRPERMASSPRIRRAAMATASCCASRRGGARSNLAHGTRRPQHERVQAQGCKVSASKESMRVCVLVCLSLGRSCPVPGCSSWASRFASRAP